MSNFILTNTSVILCPHGGVVTHIPLTVTDFNINGALPLLLTDRYIIAGCANVTGAGPSPCLEVVWTNPSNMLLVRGNPALTNLSVGLARDVLGGIGGNVIITSFQTSYQEPARY